VRQQGLLSLAASHMATADLLACCEELRRAGGSEAEVPVLLAALGRLAAQPISRELLRRTGAGREVNRAALRRHPCATVRECSFQLVRCWQQLVAIQDTAADSAGSPNKADDGETDLARCTVQELKAKIAALGLSTSQCVEKADLVALLRASPRPCTSGTPGRRRSGTRAARTSSGAALRGRRSLVRALHCVKATRVSSQRSAAAKKRPRLEERLRGIAQATDDFSALGLTRAQVQGLPEQERAELVRRCFRELACFAHPDKCPPELQGAASRAFRRLAAARTRVLHS